MGKSKKRKLGVTIIAVLIVIAISLIVIAPSVVPEGGKYCERVFESSGTEDDPLEIGNVSQLECYQNHANSSAVLTSDIQLNKSTSQTAFPIAKKKTNNSSNKTSSVESSDYLPYNGILDGQNYTISNLYINDSDETMILNNNGTIENIEVKNATVQYDTYPSESGVLVNTNNDTVNNVEVSGTISNNYSSGGQMIGGIVGENNGDIQHSESNVDINTPNSSDIGGIAGWNDGQINNSVSTGDIHGNDSVGGIVGINQYDSSVFQSFSTGNITGNRDIGGVIGNNREQIVKSYSTGSVDGYRNIGGLIGSNEGIISNTYATGDVNGSLHVGGIIGKGGGTIKTSYVTSEISGQTHRSPIVGFGSVSVDNTYWNTESTGIVSSQTNVEGTNWYVDDFEGTPLTTTQMTGRNAETNMSGFDFSKNWNTESGEYPNIICGVYEKQPCEIGTK